MIDLTSASESIGGYGLRAWAGSATDEGVGLICLVEVSDGGGRVVCRFEALLPATTQQQDAPWRGPDIEVSQRLLQHSLERARDAIAAATLPDMHGRRFEIA